MTALDTTDPTSTTDRSAIRTVTALLIAAAVTTVIAALAGIGLLVVDPPSGSTTEAAFGLTAAISGLLTAALFIGAAIYAQARGLWGHAPNWFRLALMAVVIIGVVRSVIASFS